MQYVNLGKSGLKVSRLGIMSYGTSTWRPWVLDEEQAFPLEQSIAALEIKLSEEEITALEGAYQPHPILGHT
jgi:aryl-alcohol dehydrogenase-like predicted oxidoreductase